MNGKDDWQNPEFARNWDEQTVRGNPARPEQLDILTSIVADNYEIGTSVLDIGFGSGQAEEILFQKNPNMKVVGVESSKPMIEIATRRLAGFKNDLLVVEKDIQELQVSDLPEGKYGAGFAIQVLHEIPHDKKLELLRKIHSLLSPGGMFLVMDRIKVDYRVFEEAYSSAWDRLERLAPIKSGKSYERYRERMEAKDDYPATEEEYLNMLRQAGFSAATLHLHFDRALIVGVKK